MVQARETIRFNLLQVYEMSSFHGQDAIISRKSATTQC